MIYLLGKKSAVGIPRLRMEKNMYYNYKISDETVRLANQAEADLVEIFKDIDDNAMKVSGKILSAFQELRVSSADFVDITGYGYSDPGRDKLEALYAKVFGAEDALVRPQLMSGTHALSVTLFGLLKPGETLVYISGEPYDTLSALSSMPLKISTRSASALFASFTVSSLIL